MDSTAYFFFSVILSVFICSCANQLPPSGGDDDITPPRIIFINPKHNTVNYKNNKISLKFDEYVDRRSFEESFYISPKPPGEIEFEWSGRDVEVNFLKSLDRNKTYVITIGKDFKDIRGSNTIESPITFAFSTGNKIDKGSISGEVYSVDYEKIKILSYLKNGRSEEELNPEKYPPDFITQVSSERNYKFSNLPEGEYRIFAIVDEDRNNLFDKGVDKISVLSQDYQAVEDILVSANINFLLKEFDIDLNSKEFLNKLKPDPINFIYSSISDNEKNIPPDYKFYFYFKNNNLSKADIVNNFSLTDSIKNKSYKPIFNWINDSLVEVFSTEKFNPSSELEIMINLSNTKRNYKYSNKFTIADNSNFGKVSGKIITDDEIKSPVFIKLYKMDNEFISYSQNLNDTTQFEFKEVLQGNYILFSFIDENNNNKYDKGNYYPFSPSEKFIIFETEINVKGGWSVENVFVNY